MNCPKCGAYVPDEDLKGYGKVNEALETQIEGRCCPNCGATIRIISKGSKSERGREA